MASSKPKPKPGALPIIQRSSGVTRKTRSLLPGADLGDYELIAELDSDELISHWAAFLRVGRERQHLSVLRLRTAATELPALRDAFVHDAKILSLATTKRLATVFDAGTSSGQAFLAMEPIDGLPLRDLLLAATLHRESLTLPALIQLAAQLAEALAMLHRRVVPDAPLGIVHGDIGAHSVWVTPDGGVQLLPTALGHVALHPAAPQSSDHLRFKAPEQLAQPLFAGPIDPRVDVYAFGALIWEAFAGGPLFDGADAEAAALPPSEELDGTGLSYVLGRALSRDPGERFRDGDELHAALAVLERRLQRELTARRRFSTVASTTPLPAANAALAEAFRRLVGERHRQRRDDLGLLLGR